MKKIIIFYAMLTFCVCSFSQPTVTVHGGLNLYCQDHVQDAVKDSWDDYFVNQGAPDRVVNIRKTTFIPGFNAGASVQVPIYNEWMFRTGLDFNIKGGKAEGDYGIGSPSTSFYNKWIYGYLDLPLMIQYWITQHFYLELGPELGFLLSVKNTEVEDGQTNFEETGKTDYNKVELSASGGGGYLLGDSGLGVFARFIQGLSKVYTGEDFYSNVRNSTGQFGIFYRIRAIGK